MSITRPGTYSIQCIVLGPHEPRRGKSVGGVALKKFKIVMSL